MRNPIFILLVLLFTGCLSKNDIVDKRDVFRLNGTYLSMECYLYETPLLRKKSYTWGVGLFNPEYVVEIDLDNPAQAFGLPGGGGNITKVVRINSNTFVFYIESKMLNEIDKGVVLINLSKEGDITCSLPEGGKDDTYTFYAMNNTSHGNENVPLIKFKKISGPGMAINENTLQEK